MGCLVLTCAFTLLVGFLPAGPGWAHPVTWSPSGQDLQFLQHLLDRLREKYPKEDLEAPDYETGGASDSGDDPDLGGAEIIPSHLPQLQDSLSQAQWRKFLVASRGYVSGCFGIRLDRIGTQTGLGCKSYKPRKVGCWRIPSPVLQNESKERTVRFLEKTEKLNFTTSSTIIFLQK